MQLFFITRKIVIKISTFAALVYLDNQMAQTLMFQTRNLMFVDHTQNTFNIIISPIVFTYTRSDESP